MPVAEYSSHRFSIYAPSFPFASALISPEFMEEKVTISCLARENSTFNRLFPATPLIGPNRCMHVRTELLRPVNRADEDHIALVALDIFKVLDEKLLKPIVALSPIFNIARGEPDRHLRRIPFPQISARAVSD